MALFDKPPFGNDTPVLRFDHRRRSEVVRWVLWPVFTWRLVAPIATERKINLFQRAVLNLARAGVTKHVAVSERLLIAPDLAALIAQELRSMGFVDHNNAPTPRGLKVLDDIDDEQPEKTLVGHVLSDPFSGKLWPRFLIGDLPIADIEPSEDGWPILLSGSVGDPWRERTFSVIPTKKDTLVMVSPPPKEILRAIRRHRKQRDFDELDDKRDVPLLQRISFVDDRPQPFFVALCVSRHESGDWIVEDPFGHGEAIELRARLEERLDTQSGLRSWLAPLVGSDSSEPKLRHLQADATWEVEQRLTLAIRLHAALQERLVAMHRAFFEAELFDAPSDKWDDVLVKAQRAVERALYIILSSHQDAEPPLFSQLARSDKEFNRCFLNTLATDLGFKSPLPETLSSIRRGKVQFIEQGGNGSLRPLLILVLLSADRNEEHPLRRAAPHEPDLLHRLDELSIARDQAAHDGISPEAQRNRVQYHIDTTYKIAKLVLSIH